MTSPICLCSSGFWRRADSSVEANVSEKHTASIFRAEGRQNLEEHHHHPHRHEYLKSVITPPVCLKRLSSHDEGI
jgi:hypothetical protein